MASSFCPSCGTPRTGNFRFCRKCGLDFDALAPEPRVAGPVVTAAPSAIAPPPTALASQKDARGQPASNQLAIAGGVAWIISAALIAYLALLQLGLAGQLQSFGLGDQGLTATAIWNGFAAIVTLYFGARLLRQPSREALGGSVVWAVITVVLQGYQVATGATHWAYIGSTAAALVAGVLSFAARDSVADRAVISQPARPGAALAHADAPTSVASRGRAMILDPDLKPAGRWTTTVTSGRPQPVRVAIGANQIAVLDEGGGPISVIPVTRADVLPRDNAALLYDGPQQVLELISVDTKPDTLRNRLWREKTAGSG